MSYNTCSLTYSWRKHTVLLSCNLIIQIVLFLDINLALIEANSQPQIKSRHLVHTDSVEGLAHARVSRPVGSRL